MQQVECKVHLFGAIGKQIKKVEGHTYQESAIPSTVNASCVIRGTPAKVSGDPNRGPAKASGGPRNY